MQLLKYKAYGSDEEGVWEMAEEGRGIRLSRVGHDILAGVSSSFKIFSSHYFRNFGDSLYFSVQLLSLKLSYHILPPGQTQLHEITMSNAVE